MPSLSGTTMAQLYVNGIGSTKMYPMKSKSDVADFLSVLIHEVGIPSAIHVDNAKELVHGKFKMLCKDYSIPTSYTEPHSRWQNQAESGIRELKRQVNRKMKAQNVPLWDFYCKWSCDVHVKQPATTLL